jgi:hypothetical protein
MFSFVFMYIEFLSYTPLFIKTHLNTLIYESLSSSASMGLYNTVWYFTKEVAFSLLPMSYDF